MDRFSGVIQAGDVEPRIGQKEETEPGLMAGGTIQTTYTVWQFSTASTGDIQKR